MTESTTRTEMSVILGAGDRELERRLVESLAGAGVVTAARCLDAASLLEETSSARHAAAVISAGLHGLDETTLLALRERRVPIVLLASNERHSDRFSDLAPVLLASAPAAAIVEALTRAIAGEPRPSSPPDDEELPEPVADTAADRGRVVALTSGKGAPGKSTIAIAIAAELASRDRDVVLVDGDLRGGNVAPYLNLDPRRGLIGLATGTGDLRDRVLDELQDGPGFAVLAGVERPELGGSLGGDALRAILAVLRAAYDRIVVDLGFPPDHGAVASAHELLIVTGADLVALWNTRVALGGLSERGHAARCSVIVNRREGQEHYGRDEVEQALGLPVIGAVREDRRAARQAIERQVPFTALRGRAASDLRLLAEALDGRREGIRQPAPVLVGPATEARA